jgi:hypothetical protein
LQSELRRTLLRYSTKAHLNRELKRFATKGDLRGYSAKEDVSDLRRTMVALHHETLDQLHELRRDLMYIVDNHEQRLLDLEATRRV